MRHASGQGHRRTALWSLVALLLTLGAAAGAAVSGGLLPGDDGPAEPVAAPPTAEPGSPPATRTPTPTPTPTPPPDAVFTILAAGDVLLHEPVIASARTADGGYDFAPLLAPIQPWVAGADLALCHLEVPVAPEGTRPSGYPMFGSPAAIAPSLAANGWDGCSTASNHSLDRARAGVDATLAALEAAGLGHVGTARTPEEAAAVQVYELERAEQTIRVAHLAATYGTNGIPVPADAPWSVTMLDTASLIAQATAARAAGADVVVASVHCCVEYVSAPTEEQQRIATELAASGVVDLLVGHHAHVPQPVTRLPGGPRGEGMWTAYGLGNLISNQDRNCCSAKTDSGLLVTATFRKPADGPATVTEVGWTAVTVDRYGGHVVLPLSAAVATGQPAGAVDPGDLAVRHGRVAEVLTAPPATMPGVTDALAHEITAPPAEGGTPPPVVLPRTAPGPAPAAP